MSNFSYGFMRSRNRLKKRQKTYAWRFYFLSLVLLVALFGLVWRIVELGVIKRDFLLRESAIRSIREIELPVYRGKILDRNGEVLAISVPVDAVWADPKIFHATDAVLQQLTDVLSLSRNDIMQKIGNGDQREKNGSVGAYAGREFVYLKRRVNPEVSNKIKALKIPGIFLQQEYQRYYPDAEITAQIVGFTNVDDKGQEGIELAYDNWLHSSSGKMRVLRDRFGNIIANLALIKKPEEGHDLVLSIDRRIQYLVYHVLKSAVEKYQAESGTVVVLSAKTGEILAIISVPTCNPNMRQTMQPECYKNKAITDLFEPGSTAKPFTIANALTSGKYTPNTLVDTNPGYLKINDHVIYEDSHHNYGLLSVTGVLQKSSNIGVAKINATLPANSLIDMLRKVGFGQVTESGFPGEAAGALPSSLRRRPLVQAAMAFGYNFSTTALQLARAYAVIASGGWLKPVSLLKVNEADKAIKQGGQSIKVMDKQVAKQILTMLCSVLEFGGTGRKAEVEGYRVAGKTGTARIAKPHGYYTDRHWALFVGIAPVSDPELVAVVAIKNPHGQYHGGSVAAPAFSEIMQGALRTLNVQQARN